MAEELKLVQKSYDLCSWMFDHTNKFPKSHRFSVAVRSRAFRRTLVVLKSLAPCA